MADASVARYPGEIGSVLMTSPSHHEPRPGMERRPRFSEDLSHDLPISNEKIQIPEMEHDLQAKSLSISSHDEFQNPFLGVLPHSSLDPASPNFNSKAWLSNLYGFMSKDPKRHPRRSVGISFRDLNVFGFGSPTDYQKTVGNIILEVSALARWMMGTGKQKINILKDFNGLIRSGEMVLVLGRPGSGCSTLLKTIACEIYGFEVGAESKINYQGISQNQMYQQFRGEAIYMAETDVHFPQLTVGQTLLFAAKARAPRDDTFPGVTRDMYAEHMRDVIMATFNLGQTINTNVGNEIIKGVSGGERKRVSIAEAALSRSPLMCWDNSTRGLDSANALEFCKYLRQRTQIAGATAFVSLYQGSQDAYEVCFSQISSPFRWS
jgi:ATP-binding cassette subfamily G (WHITE) protein 2 (PDR)